MQQNAGLKEMAARRSLLWRIHFWAALIASPFTLLAAVSGILYIFTPQIEGMRHGWLDHVEPVGSMLSLDAAVAAAHTALPSGWRLQSVLPPYVAGDTVRVVFENQDQPSVGHERHQPAPTPPTAAPKQARRPSAQARTVYVNPYTARVIGTLDNQDRFSVWAQKLHARLLQGEGWRWMIELAASAMLVMLLTGIALWWPATRSKFLPQAGARGRSVWKQWHGFLGVALSVITVTILATGLTWSKYTGEHIRMARNALGQAPPRMPGNLESDLGHEQALLTWQGAWDVARRLGPDVAVQMVAPRGMRGVWHISSADPSRPTKRFELALDVADGKRLYFIGWEQQTGFGKATAIGIPFHRGEFGWWNQGLLLLFGAGVLFSLFSGWVMYLKRHRRGQFRLPPVLPGAWKWTTTVPIGLATVILGILMPVLGVAACAVLLVELVMRVRAWRARTG